MTRAQPSLPLPPFPLSAAFGGCESFRSFSSVYNLPLSQMGRQLDVAPLPSFSFCRPPDMSKRRTSSSLPVVFGSFFSKKGSHQRAPLPLSSQSSSLTPSFSLFSPSREPTSSTLLEDSCKHFAFLFPSTFPLDARKKDAYFLVPPPELRSSRAFEKHALFLLLQEYSRWEIFFFFGPSRRLLFSKRCEERFFFLPPFCQDALPRMPSRNPPFSFLFTFDKWFSPPPFFSQVEE